MKEVVIMRTHANRIYPTAPPRNEKRAENINGLV